MARARTHVQFADLYEDADGDPAALKRAGGRAGGKADEGPEPQLCPEPSSFKDKQRSGIRHRKGVGASRFGRRRSR